MIIKWQFTVFVSIVLVIYFVKMIRFTLKLNLFPGCFGAAMFDGDWGSRLSFSLHKIFYDFSYFGNI